VAAVMPGPGAAAVTVLAGGLARSGLWAVLCGRDI